MLKLGMAKNAKRSVIVVSFFISSFPLMGRLGAYCQEKFRPCTADGAVAFLREMYNLAVAIEELDGYLNHDKRGILGHVKSTAKKMMSLTSKAKAKRTAPSSLTTITEGSGDDEAQDDLGVFGADDIQGILGSMDYKIDFILFGVCVLMAQEWSTDK